MSALGLLRSPEILSVEHPWNIGRRATPLTAGKISVENIQKTVATSGGMNA
jgi:hypothetical protein